MLRRPIVYRKDIRRSIPRTHGHLFMSACG
jgi:hypothetical protein